MLFSLEAEAPDVIFVLGATAVYPPPPLYSRLQQDATRQSPRQGDVANKIQSVIAQESGSDHGPEHRGGRQGQAEWRRKEQQGEGTATMGGNGDNKDNAQQLNNYKKEHYRLGLILGGALFYVRRTFGTLVVSNFNVP